MVVRRIGKGKGGLDGYLLCDRNVAISLSNSAPTWSSVTEESALDIERRLIDTEVIIRVVGGSS